MKLMGIIVVLVGIGTASGLARIGDTIEELRKRYGAASHLHDEEGAITGTPTTTGTYPFTVRGSNSAGNTDRITTIVVK